MATLLTELVAPGLMSVVEYVFVPNALKVIVGGVTVNVCETGAGSGMVFDTTVLATVVLNPVPDPPIDAAAADKTSPAL